VRGCKTSWRCAQEMVLGLCPHGFTWKMNRFRVVIPLKVFVSDVIKCRSFVTSLEGDDRKDALLPRNKEDQPPESKRVDIGVRDFVPRKNEATENGQA